MSALADPRVIDRFIRTLRLRSADSVPVYRCILRHFQRFVADQSTHSAGVAGHRSVCGWTHARRDLPVPLVYHRARLVDRFLDWLVTTRAIPSNPLADWRREYRPARHHADRPGVARREGRDRTRGAPAAATVWKRPRPDPATRTLLGCDRSATGTRPRPAVCSASTASFRDAPT